MRKILLLLILFSAPHLISQTLTYKLVKSYDMKRTLVSNHGNVLKMFDVAVDNYRGKAYSSGTQTNNISVIDLTTKSESGTLTLPFTGIVHTLRCNPANGYLLIVNAESTPNKLYLINPASNTITGTYDYSGTVSGISFNTAQNQVYVVDGPTVKVLSGSSLSSIGSFTPGFVAGGIQVDSANNYIYAVSKNVASSTAQIRVFNNTTYSLVRTINILTSENMGDLKLDVPNDRLFLYGVNQVKVVRISTGLATDSVKTGMQTSDKAYFPSSQTIYMTNGTGYSQQGQHGSWTKIYRYNVATKVLDSLKIGDKAEMIEADYIRNQLILPNMHSGWIGIFNTNSSVMDTVDIGETVDEFALSPNGSTLYMVKRLGGSRLIRYNTSTYELSQMATDNWPCVAEADSSNNRLFVLSAFYSNVSVFNCLTNALITRINLGISEGRSDAIPVMHLDKQIHKLFICFPELDTIVIVNTLTNAVENAKRLPNFNFNSDTHAAIGVIQLMSVPSQNKLFALQRVEKKLKVLNISTLTLLDSMDISSYIPSNYGTFESDLMAYDQTTDRVFIGNKIMNPADYSITGTLPFGKRVIGYKNDRSLIYSITVQTDSVFVCEHHPTTYNVTSRKFLFRQSGSATPVFYHNRQANDLYISEFNYAVFRHYDLDSAQTIGITRTSNEVPGEFTLYTNYPNPFNPVTNIRFDIPESGNVTLAVYDVTGREIKKLLNGFMHAGSYSTEFDGSGLASGVFICRIQAEGSKKYPAAIKMILVK